MLKEKKEQILAKIDEMDNYLKELRGMVPEEEDYSKNLVVKRACEKTIELVIEVVIDIAAMIVSYEKLGLPKDEENIFDLLIKNKIIDQTLGKKLKNIKGFRNILVHKYGEVDDSLVYEFLVSNLDDFEEFREVIIKFLKKNEAQEFKNPKAGF